MLGKQQAEADAGQIGEREYIPDQKGPEVPSPPVDRRVQEGLTVQAGLELPEGRKVPAFLGVHSHPPCQEDPASQPNPVCPEVQ
jgi:hypothetical protein